MVFKEKAVVFTQETTMHGVQYIGKENVHWFRRLIWTAAVLTMMGIALWQIVDKFVYYYSYPSETKTTIRNENRLDFPSVTICNLNKFRKSQLGEDAASVELVMKSLFDADQLTEDEIALVKSLPEFKRQAPNEEFRKELFKNGHQIKDMVWQLNWRGKDINVTDYFTRVITDEGVCFTFHSEEVQNNLGHKLNTTSTGTAGGLWIRMNVEQTTEYFFGPENSAGFKMLVHDPKKFPLVAELGFAVSPGTETFVSVKKNEVKSLPSPYEGSICKDTSVDSSQNPLTYFDTYNQPACRLECQTKYVLKYCGCRIYYQPGLATDPYCSPFGLFDCANLSVENYTRSRTALSDCNCFQECHTTSYEVSVSSALYPAQHILDDLRGSMNLTEDFIRKNFLEVRIFFEEMNIDTTEQKPAYEAGDLLADVGGTAGLFLGASLLTVMEMGEFLFISACSFCQHLSGASKMKQKCKEEKSTNDNDISTDKALEDKNGVYGTIYSYSRSDVNVHKIKVQEKS